MHEARIVNSIEIEGGTIYSDLSGAIFTDEGGSE